MTTWTTGTDLERAAGIHGERLVHLTRFSVPPASRLSFRAAVARRAARPSSPDLDFSLIVSLEDGDWLDISISAARALAPESGAEGTYLDLANGIVGEEDGVLVATVRAAGQTPSHSRSSIQGKESLS